MAKFQLVHFSTAKEDWAQKAQALYAEKISHFTPFELIHLKPKKLARENEQLKLTAESESLLQYLNSDDYVVVLDERGKQMSSTEFSKLIDQIQQSGKKRAIFVIGGAYGVTDEVRKRATKVISLSPMVMNHLVAQTMVLEQIYRGFTILKNIPYHNQ